MLSGGERGKPREEELLSNNHLLPLSAIQGRNKIVLSFPLESSTGTERKKKKKKKGRTLREKTLKPKKRKKKEKRKG